MSTKYTSANIKRGTYESSLEVTYVTQKNHGCAIVIVGLILVIAIGIFIAQNIGG
jgi:uncharacterized integral membrane protein